MVFVSRGVRRVGVDTLGLPCCRDGVGGAPWVGGHCALPDLPADNGEKPIAVLIEEQQVPQYGCP